MTSWTFDPLKTISTHTDGLLRAAEGNLEAPVESCPGWTVADLVGHIRDVHWSWATVVEERRQTRVQETPTWSGGSLFDDARAQAERLVRVLGEADPKEPVWTWSDQQDVGFVLRHQVQEAAVHHWDAAHAAGQPWSMDPAAAADAVEEFLRFSLDSGAPLMDELVLRAEDVGASWTIRDGHRPGALAWEPGGEGAAVSADAAQLLLWLYGRVELDGSGVPDHLLERFREHCATD